MAAHRRTLPILIGVVALVGILTVVTIIALTLRPEPFQALEYKEVSVKIVEPDGTIVIPQVPGYDIPSIRVGEAVPMFFRQCNLAGQAFDILFSTEFIHQETGLVYPVAVSQPAVIGDGCAQIRLDIPMPDRMVEDISSQSRDVGNTWSFHGVVTPNLANAEVTEFRSEQFIIATGLS